MAKYVPNNEKFTFEFDTRYASPEGDRLGFKFKTVRYTPPAGDNLGFNFTEPYTPSEDFKFAFEAEPYKAPLGNRVTFDLTQSSYIAPQGNHVSFNLTRDESEIEPPSRDAQYVYPQTFEGLSFGYDVSVRLGHRNLNVTGFNNLSLGVPGTRNDTQYLKPYGFDALGFSRQNIRNKNVTVTVTGIDLSRVATPSIINFHKNVYGKGFTNEIFSKPTIYNLLQFIRARSIESAVFGQIYLQGGVRYLRPGGMSALGLGRPVVVNTRADQTVKPTGLVPPQFPRPNVSPQILTVRGFLGTNWGSPYVQRNPNPQGWISERFGTAWVSRSPRSIAVGLGVATKFGGAKIFDAKQTVFIIDVIAGGIFGDIAIRNVNLKISPPSISAPQILDWTNVVNTSRYYDVKGFDANVWGDAEIRNATPSFTPEGFDSSKFGNTLVAERVRRINVAGFDLMGFGRPKVDKTPQLSPRSIAPIDLGLPTLSLYTRYVVTSGRNTSIFGETFIADAKRKLEVGGFNALRLGEPALSHGNRELLAKGENHSRFGTGHRLWFRVRSVAPESVFDDQLQYGHRIGGTQHLLAKGFDAALFGTRIVPESQDVLAENFKSSEFGIAKLHKSLEFLNIVGFATGGAQPADRWGKATVYNSRQYIIQTYDVDSDLNPPKIQGWMSIVNRNRTVGVTGFNTALYGRPSILNKAAPMLPKGIDTSPLGTHFISHRVRSIKLDGMEPPYISSWSNAHNDAFVIAPKGFGSQVFGTASVNNTRRYFPRIGNFETMVFGSPMVSFKIRNLSFESRYSIGPIYIPIHTVDLYTRYVESLGNDFTAFGKPALSIHKKIITPRWTLKDAFGDVGLKNVTPELRTRGRNSEDFGTTSIRTEWREITAFGDNAQLLGKANIAFRDRSIPVHGINASAIGSGLRVRGTGSPPLSTQYIYLNNVENRGEGIEDDTSVIRDGQGIPIPFEQVPRPSLRSNVIQPEGFNADRFGGTDIYSNGILMENGIKLSKECGTPMVQLSRREIGVEGIANIIVVGTPRMTPHTIYAVLESPQQARDNHPRATLHAVNSDSGTRKAGEVFGRARVFIHNPYLTVRSINPRNGYGTPKIELVKRYVDVTGIRAYRFGWHKLGDGTQEVVTRIGTDTMVFGKPTVALDKDKLIQVRPSGIASLASGRPVIEFFHRKVTGRGFNSLTMGSSRGGTLYKPQSLHVGFPLPTKPVGSLMEKFGDTYIGLKVRDVGAQGFDACLIEYSPAYFNERMRVSRGQGGTQPVPAQAITPVGFDALRSNASNVKPGVYYIRPDGNADQFRKGGW